MYFTGRILNEGRFEKFIYRGGIYFRTGFVKEDWLINMITHTKSQNKLLLQMEISDHLIVDEIIVPK